MLNKPEIRVETAPKRKAVELCNKDKSAKADAEHERGHLVPPLSFCNHDGDCKSVKEDPGFKEKPEIFVEVDFLVNQASLKCPNFYQRFNLNLRLPES